MYTQQVYLLHSDGGQIKTIIETLLEKYFYVIPNTFFE